MAVKSNHYGAAFEAYLRSRSIPYVNVRQAKKALFADTRLKSFDFVVYSKEGPSLLIDVNGRICKNPKHYECWTTESDVDDLVQWEAVFGDGFKGLVAFVYWVGNQRQTGSRQGMFQFRDRWYQMMAITLADYRSRMRRRSAKWETVALPTKDFHSLARPLESWL